MTEEPSLRGFIARLQAKSDTNSEGLTFMERKYKEAVERVKNKK